MEIKKIKVEGGIYNCNIDVSVNEWKKILQDKSFMTRKYIEALIKFYQEPEHKSTCKDYGIKHGESPQSINGIITGFTKAVQKKLNRFSVIGSDGTPIYWIIAMTGRNVGKYFEWKMRPELVQAMEEIGMVEFEMIGKQKSKISEQMIKYIDLLKSNKNIILTGAPGTGKTYLAKRIAEEMDAEICFTQFHPSFDYSDFVEGLRPTSPDESGNIGFELKDGIFKSFCKKALINKISNFDEIYDQFIDDITNYSVKLETPIMRKNFSIEVNSKKSCYVIPNTEKATKMVITKEMIRDYVENGMIRDWKSYITAIGDYIKQNYKIDSKDISDRNKPFVFIIDEINRGEISKIFGELFFSIDPSYRGKDGKVKTQYSNMQHYPNEFDKNLNSKIEDSNFGYFYVPENVYIIGTMNDIDRSVESFDFAMRRRFTWVEITAKESQKMLDESWKEEAIQRMDSLNNAIWNEKEKKGIESLNSSYHIGAAYFKTNLPKYNENERFDKLWEHHLRPLLFEYLRGMSNAESDLENLKSAYDKPAKDVMETPKSYDSEIEREK